MHCIDVVDRYLFIDLCNIIPNHQLPCVDQRVNIDLHLKQTRRYGQRDTLWRRSRHALHATAAIMGHASPGE